MEFKNIRELRQIGKLIGQGDFERADVRWSGQKALLTLKTSRPPEAPQEGGGLFRKPKGQWIPCQLVIRNVQSLSVWEEEDVIPPGGDPGGGASRGSI